MSELLAEPRLRREKRLQDSMLKMYCKHHHIYQGKLCSDCQRLQEMCTRKLALCESGANKPTCVSCRHNCYSPVIAKQARIIFRWARFRIWLRHPVSMFFYVIYCCKRSRMPKPRLLDQ